MSEELEKSAKEMEIRRFGEMVGEMQAYVDRRQGDCKFFFFLAPLVLAAFELAISLGLYLRPHGMGLLYAIPIVAIAVYHYTRFVPLRKALDKAKAGLAELEEKEEKEERMEEFRQWQEGEQEKERQEKERQEKEG